MKDHFIHPTRPTSVHPSRHGLFTSTRQRKQWSIDAADAYILSTISTYLNQALDDGKFCCCLMYVCMCVCVCFLFFSVGIDLHKLFLSFRKNLANKMGKVKIETQKLEEENNRRSTFLKTSNGVLKKAYELSILCDTNVAIIAFSLVGELLYYCNTRYDVRLCICTHQEEEYCTL